MIAEYYRGRRSDSIEYREKLPDGAIRWLKLSIDLVESPHSSDVEAYLMYENIDDEKRNELQIKAHAETDPLTGILNRTTFAEKMDRLIAQRKPGSVGALLMLDIDDFKLLNDHYGHIAGDQALIEVGRRLQSTLRPSDLVGRLGGDEFIVYIGDLPDRGVIARKAEDISEKLRSPLGFGTNLDASMGISVCPDDGSNFASLYERADIALYHSKRTGKRNYAFYCVGMGIESARS